MAKFTLEEAPVFELIPEETILEAEVVNCEQRETPFWIDVDDHSKGKQEEISFRFKVTEPGEFFGRTLFGRTPPWFNTSPKCRLRIWTQEILGVDELAEGFEFDTDDLITMPVKIVIGHQTIKKGKPDEEVRDRVVDLIRMDGGLGYAQANDVF
jgi:hypothetical protein